MSEFIDKLPVFDEEIKQASILKRHKKSALELWINKTDKKAGRIKPCGSFHKED